MQYDMAQLNTDLGLPERFYLTREKGEAAYNKLVDVLKATPEGEPLVLEFPAEQLVDSSFADEAIIRLMEALMGGVLGDRTVLLTGLTEDSIHNVNAAIHLRNLKLALLIVEADGTWTLVGQLERSLRETLEMLAKSQTMTAPELSEQIGSAVNTASNRLKRLYDGRLIRREDEVSERGLQYVYHFWHW
jgi:DNA-binding transcriptional ArsR family regulator